jgi:hypothetical protein
MRGAIIGVVETSRRSTALDALLRLKRELDVIRLRPGRPPLARDEQRNHGRRLPRI